MVPLRRQLAGLVNHRRGGAQKRHKGEINRGVHEIEDEWDKWAAQGVDMPPGFVFTAPQDVHNRLKPAGE